MDEERVKVADGLDSPEATNGHGQVGGGKHRLAPWASWASDDFVTLCLTVVGPYSYLPDGVLSCIEVYESDQPALAAVLVIRDRSEAEEGPNTKRATHHERKSRWGFSAVEQQCPGYDPANADGRWVAETVQVGLVFGSARHKELQKELNGGAILGWQLVSIVPVSDATGMTFQFVVTWDTGRPPISPPNPDLSWGGRVGL